ncbi:DNA polymerase/3'-5' exonuclease PolX [Bradyrhizobium sp. 180]|uniref:PHP domain-containing protein n=1 Tax=unclassified Bradyrhizobium TaxID=2631580 RepID=UPI001FFA607C|nr:DNA polymerase/3'-5' exonuclease PolX [Bradyrhizobium sp. CW12]MCK1491289.1 DNA polymerase/3'-5' exonuclease PolX [Bradyrhizobium sp. 180]MCK1530120.1 DNA polymerase/3'-5' exonuclease PolX [Bradyrhizobium sp. 182]MCK1593996.1 DNA polymerase/3'-5' exonuclease PolX [Bradyrhizobium sp. 164]MCK1649671.1 DNA polymerase/3'-5' exonuclease PolX [Bradyrhizobium sp. 154]MCK1670076.1 DNA polymerase/3'-5' exonuclease PolX [Bradyrhizobium sp. 153]
MAVADTPRVTELLREYAQRTALRGGNPYRAKAYANAADNLAALVVPLHVLIEEDRLTEIPGVGEAIADIITKLYRTGTHPSLEKLRKEIPAGVLELLTVPGLRPEKVLKLYKDLGITSLSELETAAEQDRIKKAKGLGAALQTKIVENLAIAKSGKGRLHLHRAAALLEHATDSLRKARPELRRLTIAGDFRRGCELVADFAIVAEAAGSGSVIESGGLQVHLADRKHFGAALLHATGSPVHLDQLRALADKKGMRLEPDGLHKGRSVVAETEEDIYRALGLPFIAPELREGRGEIERALKKKLPRLVTDQDLRGILHCHTDASDGTETLESMAKATLKRGFEYFGVADHSQSAHYAGGLSLEQIKEQHRQAERLNRKFGKDFRILRGIESDILADGSLDYPDEVLDGFDFVVASIHGRFRLDRKAQTERLLRAVANPYTTIVGHMTGRQLQRRPGYEIDVEKVLRACAKHDVAIEINAHPWRLDLDWRWHQAALEYGCMLSINPDAHSIAELDHMHWGVEMARKGGVPAERVLNAMPLADIERYLRHRRRSFARAA